MATATPLQTENGEFGNNAPKRARKNYKVALAAESSTGWIDKRGFAIVTASWGFDAGANTMTVQGRYRDENGDPDAESVCAVGDSSGIPLSIDMNQGASGSSIALDSAGNFDDIKIDFASSITDEIFIGLGG